MSKPFNRDYVRGTTNEQLKTSMSYTTFLKTDDEIEGVRGDYTPTIKIVETRIDKLEVSPCTDTRLVYK